MLHVPARDIPVPVSVSEAAREFLAVGPRESLEPWPPIDDLDGWRTRIAQQDAQLLAIVGGRASTEGCAIAEVEIDGALAYVVTPEDSRARGVHGGSRRRS